MLKWRKAVKKPVPIKFRSVRGSQENVRTKNGVVVAHKDEDYILKGVEGELYPCNIKIFRKTYDVLLEGEELQQNIRQIGENFLEALKTEIDSAAFLGDLDRLNSLICVVRMCLDSELLTSLRKKGLGKDIMQLCDKAGRLPKKESGA